MLGLFRKNKNWPCGQGGKRHSRPREQHVQCLELGEIRAHSGHMDFWWSQGVQHVVGPDWGSCEGFRVEMGEWRGQSPGLWFQFHLAIPV